MGIGVGEHAQNALTTIGPRDKGVKVQALVIGPPRLHARFYLRGAKTGGCHAQYWGVSRQQAVNERLRLRAKPQNHCGQGLLSLSVALHALYLQSTA